MKARKLVPNLLVNLLKHYPQAVTANLRYGFPSKQLKVIGVTGTDGKTTTVNMIYQILKNAGKKVSVISTINAHIAGKTIETGLHVTSPDAKDLQRYLKLAKENQDEYIVLEVTSHSLEQFRVWGIDFEVGVITNITHEHLDYHRTFSNYLNAKAKLIKKAKWTVLNRDDASFAQLKSLAHGKVLSFGFTKSADLNPYNFPLNLKLPGEFNAANAQAAALVNKILGVSDRIIKRSLEEFNFIAGRMQSIKNNRGIKIVVDFAHTPNGLKVALETLRKECKGKLIAVFGAASERDKLKRPMMGKIAAKIADITILTDEDPRFEDEKSIINEIAAGAGNLYVDGVNLFKQPNRMKAILKAISLAKRGDMIGIFGKGHEKSINYRGVEKPWSDEKAVLRALKYARQN